MLPWQRIQKTKPSMRRAGGYILAYATFYSTRNVEIFLQKNCYRILPRFSSSELI